MQCYDSICLAGCAYSLFANSGVVKNDFYKGINEDK